MNKSILVVMFFSLTVVGCSQSSTSTSSSDAMPVKVAETQEVAKQAAAQVTTGVKSMVQSASDAIKESVNQGDVQKQIDYLLTQAKNLMGQEKYDQVVSIANHILTNLDSNSTQAKGLLEDAKAKLAEKANAMVGDAKNKLGSFMKQ